MKILFLSTWFPYPPNQGSKIRAYYLLKALSQNHEIALVSFEDVEILPEWKAHISSLCALTETLPRKPFEVNIVRKWLGWASRLPSSVVAVYSREMDNLVRDVSSYWKPDCIVAMTFVTAPYALDINGVPKILDIDNVMTRMLGESFRIEKSPLARIRRWLAYTKFRRFEELTYPKFDCCMVCTDNDKDYVSDVIQLSQERTVVVPNGVDTAYYENSYDSIESNSLVFNGALTYSANFEAMRFFLKEVFPNIIQEIPEVKLRITGSIEGVPIELLSPDHHVEFTGYLDDIRPTVSMSWACVVPLISGGGTRLKILEAMALGTPVISTPKGAEGLEVQSDRNIIIAETPEEFASQIIRVLHSPQLRENLAKHAIKLVKNKYEWSTIGANFNRHVEAMVDGSVSSLEYF